MEIRLAKKSDIQELNALYDACSEKMKVEFNLNHWNNPYPRELLEKRIDKGTVYKVNSNDQMIGSFMLEEEYPQPYINAINMDNVPFRYLTRLAVMPNTQSKGIGSKTLKQAEEIAKSQGAKIMRLDLLSEYPQLEQFYIKNGYKRIGIGKTRHFTVIFMEKEFKD